MHSVEVQNDAIYHKWLRENATGKWTIYFGDEVDIYDFEESTDADMLSIHIADRNEKYTRLD